MPGVELNVECTRQERTTLFMCSAPNKTSFVVSSRVINLEDSRVFTFKGKER
jgi:hypothetical protein